ncbi:vWA domain-containing protein [Limnoraphis robusta]|uniref:VWA domain-containing protein n=1 Tax=Limnoraphis robusta CCNP1315 TaxID=3110306 RepID=A0ABU5TSF7_9CYAN|nr:VWA domain-containing protein [Limnoraphis robusta]MEA5517581.1 VWA domain-containing protein [Limnoraphis robusta CCNP1315]MEA5544617.1 VWA domain-containing protein [Limnoraphis robusta CCNP1324]
MDFKPEYAETPDPRCPVVLLLDTSGSMYGQPINQLNQGLVTFQQELSKDSFAARRVQVAIVTFDSYVKVVQDFVDFNQFNPPHLTATGSTAMGEGIETAINLIESHKQLLKANAIDYYRPWLLMITDGGPNPDSNWQNAAQILHQFHANKKVVFFAIAVQGADMNTLSQIVPPGSIPPQQLQGLAFNQLFTWLSSSMGSVSRSQGSGAQVALPDASGWVVGT